MNKALFTLIFILLLSLCSCKGMEYVDLNNQENMINTLEEPT